MPQGSWDVQRKDNCLLTSNAQHETWDNPKGVHGDFSSSWQFTAWNASCASCRKLSLETKWGKTPTCYKQCQWLQQSRPGMPKLMGTCQGITQQMETDAGKSVFCGNGYNTPKPGFSFLPSKCQVILSVEAGTGTRFLSYILDLGWPMSGMFESGPCPRTCMHQATLASFTNLGMLCVCKNHREVVFWRLKSPKQDTPAQAWEWDT